MEILCWIELFIHVFLVVLDKKSRIQNWLAVDGLTAVKMALNLLFYAYIHSFELFNPLTASQFWILGFLSKTTKKTCMNNSIQHKNFHLRTSKVCFILSNLQFSF